ncbi:MAG: ATP-binding protein [Candidatus Latescibacterota bacterium]
MLIALLVTLSVIMISTALIELYQSRIELRLLMTHQAHSLLESLQVSARNAIIANDRLEETMRRRLFDNADFVRQLYEEGRLSNERLVALAEDHRIHRIRVVRPDGSWAFSNHPRVEGHDTLSPPRPDLTPIFSGTVDTMIIHIRPARAEAGFRHGVVVAARDRSAILLNLDAGQLLRFRSETGLGPLLKNLTVDPNIVYIALQDTSEILAAAGQTAILNREDTDDGFLHEAWFDTTHIPRERVLEAEGARVLEVVHPFVVGQLRVGLFRVGLSMEPIAAIDRRLVRRLIIISGIILLLGFFVLAFIVVRQNADIARRQYQVIETYSSQVIDTVGDGIIVFNTGDGVQTINPAARDLLGLDEGAGIGRPIDRLLSDDTCREFLESPAVRDQVACDLHGGRVFLLITKTDFVDENGKLNTILVLRDQTRMRELEDQIRHRERTIEMSTLASGLAHEIRNPLNAVGTIVQQLRKDFQPTEDKPGYVELTDLVYAEVKRINEAIQEFLQSVKPKLPEPEPFEISEMLRFVEHAFETRLRERGVVLSVTDTWKGVVSWDRDQMQHVMMNLVENALDACSQGDRIEIRTRPSGSDQVEIQISDTGRGIPAEIRDRIFNLYFTTKASGTGIGLAMVRRTVIDHGGTVDAISPEGEGSTFTVRLPVNATIRSHFPTTRTS